MATGWRTTFPGPDGSPVPVRLHTNLDLHRAEQFPERLSCRPLVGDMLRSTFRLPKAPDARLELRVSSVTHGANGLEVELSAPSYYPTLLDFYEWYQRATGQRYV